MTPGSVVRLRWVEEHNGLLTDTYLEVVVVERWHPAGVVARRHDGESVTVPAFCILEMTKAEEADL